MAGVERYLPTRHAFYDQLRRMPLDFTRLTAAWDGVDAGRLSDYFESLPPEWIPTADAREQIMDYLLALKSNLEPTLA